MSYIFSIIIPTVKYSIYLDEAIKSCLDADVEAYIVVCVNNKSFNGFENSIYFNSSYVKWECFGEATVPMQDSWNKAIDLIDANWIFILSDDDIIHKKFLGGIDLNKLDYHSLYTTSVEIINKNGEFIRTSNELEKNIYLGNEIIQLFFNNKLHHHLSLFVFHKKLFDLCGGYEFTGYPNGYYLDTVLHGKMMANCNAMIVSELPVFSRREFADQASAKFYFDNVNEYFYIIVEALFCDKKFKDLAVIKYKTKKLFYRKMIQDRFFTEWSKLNKNIFNNSYRRKIIFLYKYLFFWKAGAFFKMTSFFYVFLFPLKELLPKSLLFHIKKYLGNMIA